MSKKRTLTYDSRDMRYHGVNSTGGIIQIDADAFDEALQERIRELMAGDGEGKPSDYDDSAATDEQYDQAMVETADPDGWDEDMAGWIPGDE